MSFCCAEYKMDTFNIKTIIYPETTQISRKFKTTCKNYRIHFQYKPYNSSGIEYDLQQIITEIYLSFDRIIKDILNPYSENDYIRISLRNASLDRDILIHFKQIKFFHINQLFDEINNVLQSKKEFILYGELRLNIIIVKEPRIGGVNDTPYVDLDKWKHKSTKVIPVANDGLCLARAIVISKAYADGLKDNNWRRLREDRGKKKDQKGDQTIAAEKLCSDAGVNITMKKGFKYSDIEKFQQYLLNQYQLIVVTPPKQIVEKGIPASKQIFVLIMNDHADCLLSIKAFLRCNYFCRYCVKGFMSIVSHKCDQMCNYCYSDKICEKVVDIICKECNRKFVSNLCYNNHKLNRICKYLKFCKICRKTFKEKKHVCNQKKCRICKMYVPISHHECFITKNNKNLIENEDNMPKIFIFYDFETFIQENDNEKVHRENFVSIKTACDYCWNSTEKYRNKYCQFCGAENKSYFGTDCTELFLNFLFDIYASKLRQMKITFKLKKLFKVLVIAHNAKAYDSHFIIKYCLNNNYIPKNIIKKGTKILSMKIKMFHFIDSLNFLPLPLKSLPKAFGIDNIVKGDFPHSFNKPENWYKNLNQLPDLDYYDPDQKTEKKRNEFIDWYNENKNN